MSDARQTIEQMLTHDRIDDAIDFLLTLLTPDSRFRNELLGHYAELRRIERAERLGLAGISGEQGRRRLTHVLLELAELIFAQLRHAPLGVTTSTISATVPDDASLEKIIGTNNLKKVAWLQQGLNCAAAVGRIVTRRGSGTGFRISGNRIVTNHHVLASERDATEAVIEFNYEEDIHGRLVEHFVYRFDAASFRTDKERDVSVVGLAATPDAPPPERWGELSLNAQVPQIGDHVSIIQHPNGGVKQIACTANQVVNTYGHRLQYLTDTLPGASGAPVFDDNWAVVAIHHAGGNLRTNARGDTRYVNEGILVGDVAHLFR